MKKRTYVIPSLLLAGFAGPRETLAALPHLNDGSDGSSPLFDLLNGDKGVLVSMHASHASHASHVSGSGGGYIAPLYNPPPVDTGVMTAPAPQVPDSPAINAATAPASELVAMVQKALTSFGYYHGPISGVVDAGTEAAIVTFQTQWNIQPTGTITPDLLSKLKIGE